MKRLIFVFVCFCLLVSVSDYSFAKRPKVSKKNQESNLQDNNAAEPEILISFDKGKAERYGAWIKDLSDTTQEVKYTLESPGSDGKGKCLKIMYDVDSPNEAYGGIWVQLINENSIDLTEYKNLVFWIKGDKSDGYTTNVKIELKSDRESSAPYIDGITGKWTKIEVPLDEFNTITDWSKMKQFVISFDSECSEKSGTIYIDSISFEK